MRITVHYMAQLRRLAGVGQETLDVPAGLLIADLLLHLVQGHGDDYRQIVLDAAGQPHRSLLLFVGDDQVRCDSPRPLRDGDVVTLLTPMAGG